jgi:hypothetical protein
MCDDLDHRYQVECCMVIHVSQSSCLNVQTEVFATVFGHRMIGLDSLSGPATVAESCEEKARSRANVEHRARGLDMRPYDPGVASSLRPQQVSFTAIVGVAAAARGEIGIRVHIGNVGCSRRNLGELVPATHTGTDPVPANVQEPMAVSETNGALHAAFVTSCDPKMRFRVSIDARPGGHLNFVSDPFPGRWLSGSMGH